MDDQIHAIVFLRSWATLQNRHVFFNLKNYEWFFVLKRGKLSFSLWPDSIRFGRRGWVVGVRAKSEVWVQDFAIIKVLDTAQWIRNAIWTTFNNASCIIFAK